jgi:hypothetical protein
MKHLHSRIRATAATLYASAHPEIRYKDIAIALGYSEKDADTAVSHVLRKAGVSRPRGFAAPAYSAKSKAKAWNHTWSRATATRMLEAGKQQVGIARKVGCSQGCISQLAIELGIGGRKQQQTVRAAKQKKLIALLKDDPSATLGELAEELNTVSSCVFTLLRDMGLCTYRSERNQLLASGKKGVTA